MRSRMHSPSTLSAGEANCLHGKHDPFHDAGIKLGDEYLYRICKRCKCLYSPYNDPARKEKAIELKRSIEAYW